MQRRVIIAAFCGVSVLTIAAGVNTDYITPSSTFSPDHRYGVTIPVFHIEAAQEPDDRMNKVVELRTGNMVAVLHADPPGYDRALNHHEAPVARWSPDSSVLLWEIGGKWCPDALILLKVEQNRAKWQLDLLKTAQQAVLSRTRNAKPKQYKICKDDNEGNGSAFPEGFTIDVTTDAQYARTVSLPLAVHADLTANPKQIEGKPNLDSHLDVVITPNGRLIVKDFYVTSPPSEQDIAQKIVGDWQGAVHIRSFYTGGGFALDPQPGEKPTGTWKLRGDQVITQSSDDPNPMIEHIVKITGSEMVSIYDGTRYTYKRVVH